MPEALRSWCLLSDIVRLPDNFGVEEGRMVRLPNNFGDEEGKSYRSYMRCAEKKAFGFSDEDEANKLVRSLVLEAQIAAPTEPAEPLGLSFLNLLGGYSVPASVYATDRNQLLILQARIPCDYSDHVFLIYDAIKEELIMIPSRPPNLGAHLATCILVARPDITNDDGSYALVMTGKKIGDSAGVEMPDSVFVWLPSRQSSWEELSGGARFPPQCYQNDFLAGESFSFNGCCYWADLHCGLMYCTTDALLSSANCGDLLEFSFIDLPVNPTGHVRSRRYPVAWPRCFRAIGFVKGYSAIKFISINGFIEPVDLEKRTVTVWRLQLQDDHTHKCSWDKEGELSLEALWGLEGFNLPKDLTPMHPFLSVEDDNVIYFMLGRTYVNSSKGLFVPLSQHYLICVDMRHKILVSSTRLTDQFAIDKLLRYRFTQYAPLMKKTEEDGSSGESMDDAAPLATALIALQAAATEDDKKRKRTTESDQEVAQN